MALFFYAQIRDIYYIFEIGLRGEKYGKENSIICKS